jgi:2-polyprenyl-3-methyl-5-hydroxy-6-metoxy-1,4-benzoquinol methylase
MISDKELAEFVSDLHPHIFDEDIAVYNKYANLVNDTYILDVGTGLGKSALALALANLTNNVHTFDDGSKAIEYGWATSLNEYKAMIEERILRAPNLYFAFEDILQAKIPTVGLFHLDDEEEEGKILAKVFPHIKHGGILLVRNYLRFKETVDRICKGCQYLESKGLIQVIKKV